MGCEGLDCIVGFGGVICFKEGVDDWAPVVSIRVGNVSVVVLFEAVAGASVSADG